MMLLFYLYTEMPSTMLCSTCERVRFLKAIFSEKKYIFACTSFLMACVSYRRLLFARKQETGQVRCLLFSFSSGKSDVGHLVFSAAAAFSNRRGMRSFSNGHKTKGTKKREKRTKLSLGAASRWPQRAAAITCIQVDRGGC